MPQYEFATRAAAKPVKYMNRQIQDFQKKMKQPTLTEK